MSYFEIEPGDENILVRCPKCHNGYMVPTMGDWYQCSECGIEAYEENDVLWYSAEDLDD